MEFTLRNGEKRYARLIRDQILHVGRTPDPTEYSKWPFRPHVELILDSDDGMAIWRWIQGLLGPTKEKSYASPGGLIPELVAGP